MHEGAPQTSSPLEGKEKREALVEELKSEAFETQEESHGEKEFHNQEHPKEVLEASKKFAEFMLIDPDTISDEAEREKAIEENEKIRVATELAAAWHDTVINTDWKENMLNPKAFKYGQYTRFGGFGEDVPPNVKDRLDKVGGFGNEEASFELLKKIAREKDPEGTYITDEILELSKKAIKATYPDVPFPPPIVQEQYLTITTNVSGVGEDGLTINQGEERTIDLREYLPKDKKENDGDPDVYRTLTFTQLSLDTNPDATIPELAVGTGDLSYPGRKVDTAKDAYGPGNMEGQEISRLIKRQLGLESDEEKAESDAFVVELEDKLSSAENEEAKGNLETALADLKVEKIEDIPPARKAAIAGFMMGWIKTQIQFDLGQKIRFENLLKNSNELKALPREKLENIESEYQYFDDHIALSITRFERVKESYSDLTNPETYNSSDAEDRFKELAREMEWDI